MGARGLTDPLSLSEGEGRGEGGHISTHVLGAARVAGAGAAIEGPGDRAADGAERLAAFLGAELVHRIAFGGEHHAVDVARRLGGYFSVLHVGEYARRIALQRVTVAGAARHVFPELVSRMQLDHLLGGQLLPLTVVAEDEGAGGSAGLATVEPPRRGGEAL